MVKVFVNFHAELLIYALRLKAAPPKDAQGPLFTTSNQLLKLTSRKEYNDNVHFDIDDSDFLNRV
jgi:hypothetical protein